MVVGQPDLRSVKTHCHHKCRCGSDWAVMPMKVIGSFRLRISISLKIEIGTKESSVKYQLEVRSNPAQLKVELKQW